MIECPFWSQLRIEMSTGGSLWLSVFCGKWLQTAYMLGTVRRRLSRCPLISLLTISMWNLKVINWSLVAHSEQWPRVYDVGFCVAFINFGCDFLLLFVCFLFVLRIRICDPYLEKKCDIHLLKGSNLVIFGKSQVSYC